MTLLWAVFAGMALLGALFVILPVLRYQSKADVSGELVNSLVYRDRLKELDLELASGVINEAQYQQLKQELELTLLSDVQATAPDQSEKSNSGKWVAWVLILVIPVAGGFVYWSEGYRSEVGDWFSQQEKMKKVMPLMMAGNYEAAEKEGIKIEDFVRSLQKHLQQNTQDAKGWYLLGASYTQMRMAEQGELAFRRALNLDPQNVDYMMGFAQATLALNSGNLTPAVQKTLTYVIQQQPNNPKPYMTWGMGLYQQGDFQGAIDIWQQYLQQDNIDQRAAQLLQRSITSAQAEMENSDTEMPAATEKAELLVTVSVTESVQAALKPTDILFVYAKATSGPPMPLAVVRQPVGQWPVSALLNDSNAMTPAMALSKFDQVVVQARVSPSGNAIPQSGDWIGPSQVIDLKPGQQSLALEINNRMP